MYSLHSLRCKPNKPSQSPQSFKTALLFEALEQRTCFSGVVDQEVFLNEGFFARFGPNAPILQSFKQVHDNIVGASVLTHSNGTGSGNVTISLFDGHPGAGGILLARATDSSVSAGDWATVDFPYTSIVPEATYFLQFDGSNGNMGVASTSRNFTQADAYPRGQGYHNGNPIAQNDVNFRTLYTSPVDLSATSLTIVNGNVNFSYEISGAALAAETTVNLYWSDDASFDAGDLSSPALRPQDVIQVAAGTTVGTYPDSVAVSALNSTPKRYLLLVTDPSNVIRESDEPTAGDLGANNVVPLGIPDVVGTAFDYRVIADDLQDLNELLPINAQFVITARLRNQGTGDAASFNVKFYASTDSTIDGSDILLDTQVVSAVASGQARTVFTPRLTLPQNLELSGIIRLGMVIDGNSAILEADKSNNSNKGDGEDYRPAQLADLLPPVLQLTGFPTAESVDAYLRGVGFEDTVFGSPGLVRNISNSRTIVSPYDGTPEAEILIGYTPSFDRRHSCFRDSLWPQIHFGSICRVTPVTMLSRIHRLSDFGHHMSMTGTIALATFAAKVQGRDAHF